MKLKNIYFAYLYRGMFQIMIYNVLQYSADWLLSFALFFDGIFFLLNDRPTMVGLFFFVRSKMVYYFICFKLKKMLLISKISD